METGHTINLQVQFISILHGTAATVIGTSGDNFTLLTGIDRDNRFYCPTDLVKMSWEVFGLNELSGVKRNLVFDLRFPRFVPPMDTNRQASVENSLP